MTVEFDGEVHSALPYLSKFSMSSAPNMRQAFGALRHCEWGREPLLELWTSLSVRPMQYLMVCSTQIICIEDWCLSIHIGLHVYSGLDGNAQANACPPAHTRASVTRSVSIRTAPHLGLPSSRETSLCRGCTSPLINDVRPLCLMARALVKGH